MKQTLTPVLEWSASTGTEIQFEYCYQPAVIGNVCLSWTPVNANSVTPPSLAYGTTYIWQVRATNSAGTTYANGSASEVWSFTTLGEEPKVFDKITPVDGAIDRSITPYLYWWAPLDGNTTYDYCISTTNACPGNVWTPIGRNAAIHPDRCLSFLTPNSTYYWQVRATKVGFAPVEADGAWWSFKANHASSANQ